MYVCHNIHGPDFTPTSQHIVKVWQVAGGSGQK